MFSGSAPGAEGSGTWKLCAQEIAADADHDPGDTDHDRPGGAERRQLSSDRTHDRGSGQGEQPGDDRARANG
jgi:hypothetical protein